MTTSVAHEFMMLDAQWRQLKNKLGPFNRSPELEDLEAKLDQVSRQMVWSKRRYV